MNQSDPLHLVESGSLIRPGPIGRIVRLVFGALCLYTLVYIVLYRWSIITAPVSAFLSVKDHGVVSVRSDLVMASLVALFVLNYVVNIGLGKSWGRWPSYLSVAVDSCSRGVALYRQS